MERSKHAMKRPAAAAEQAVKKAKRVAPSGALPPQAVVHRTELKSSAEALNRRCETRMRWNRLHEMG